MTGQDKELYFWRSPGSGSVATINLGNSAISGDIIALKPEASWFTDIFSIEAKNGYKDYSFDKVLKKNKSDPMLSFWEQATGDARSANKLPMLLYRKKGLKPWCGICERSYEVLKGIVDPVRSITIHWENMLPDIYLYDMEEFFKVVTVHDVYDMFKSG
jgi:hypothetical protein